jgi:uncharacterized protein (TIGR02145 family)
MMRKLLKISVLVLFVILVLFSCKKDKNDSTTNVITKPVFNPNISYGTMTDQDNNVYKTVTIGTQTWMAENLRTTKYNDGTDIPNIVDNDEWRNLTAGAYCNLLNVANTEIIAIFGHYYNWYAVNTGKLAPNGWHVPTDAEWTKLIDYLGGQYIAGAKLKETGTHHWIASNNEVTNETGFTALPGGERYISYISSSGEFGGGAATGCWWSATESATDLSCARVMYNSDAAVYRFDNYKLNGLAVRLVKD